MWRSAESFCALAWATRAWACARPACAVCHAAFWLSYSDFAISASLNRPCARVQSSWARSKSDWARFRSAIDVFSAASAATESVAAASTASLGGVHVGRGLHVFQLRQQLTLLDPVAFLDVKPGDLAEGIGADVDVSLRLDLAGCAHNRSQVLSLRFAGLDRDHALAALVNGNAGNRQRLRWRLRCRSVFSFLCSLLPVRYLRQALHSGAALPLRPGIRGVTEHTPSDTVMRAQKFLRNQCG